jgi:NitT/TauT family transport system substrate-binding protein
MNSNLKTTIAVTSVLGIIALSSIIYLSQKNQIGYLATNNSIPLYVAQEKNYFQESGIEAELIKFEAPNLFVDAMVGGQIDFSAPSLATGIMSIVETKNPDKFKVFGANYSDANNPSDVVIIPKDSEAKSFSDLKSKTCATLAGPQFKTIFTKLAKDVGLKATESGKDGDIFYKEMPVGEFVTALSSKAVDCIVGLEPAGTIAVAKGVGKILGTSNFSQAFGGRWYGGISAVNNQFAKNNPNTTKLVISAIDKATKAIQIDPALSKSYLPKYLGVSAEVSAKMNIPAFVGSQDLSEKDYQGIDSFLAEFEVQGTYKTKPDFRKITYK